MIGILIFPDFQLLDAAGPISVFEIAGRFSGVDQSIRTLAVTPGPVRKTIRRIPELLAHAGAALQQSGIGPRVREWINREEPIA